MNNSFYWKEFEKTGNITDYLSYTACTSEESQHNNKKEGEHGGETNNRHRNGISLHAHWGL